MSLLEEMGLTDTMNASEWNEDKKKAQKATLKKLNAKRDEARRAKALRTKKARKVNPAFLKSQKRKIKTAKTTRRDGRKARGPVVGAEPPAVVCGADPTLGVAPGAGQPVPVGAQAPPAVTTSDAQAPPGVDAAITPATAPSELGGWRVIAVTNGWIKYHPVELKIDSHCERHGKSCKMDRKMARGSIGLSVAWLKRGLDCTHRSDHIVEKAAISSSDCRELRVAGRQEFTLRSENPEDPVAEKMQELLLAERRARKSAEPLEEPLALPCPDISRELARCFAPENAS